MIYEEEIPEASEIDAIVEDGQCEVMPFARNEDKMPFGTDGGLNPSFLVSWVRDGSLTWIPSMPVPRRQSE